jgi:hypothetical protein
VLLGRRATTAQRVRKVLALTLLALLPVAAWYALAAAHVIDWPQASGPLGVFLGIVGGLIVLFEMALAPRKWLRGRRLGVARLWMRWHIWLGLAVLPMIVIHSGFAWGGWLSAMTMVLFLLVIASGIYGLIVQQWLPKRLFDEIPNETVASQVDFAVLKHVAEAKLVAASGPLAEFNDSLLDPYLRRGSGGGSALNSATEAARVFARLRLTLPAEAEPNVLKLERLADLRRQWDRQRRLNWWLHNWLLVHLPLSVLMTSLMLVHAAKAMRWW